MEPKFTKSERIATIILIGSVAGCFLQGAINLAVALGAL